MKRILLALVLLLGTLLVIPAASANASALDQNPNNGNAADGANPIGKRCAAMTGATLRGTLTGQDHLGINATIGLDMKDAQGRAIDLGGCPTAAYTTVLQLNHYINGHGAKLGTVMHDVKGVAQGTVGNTWYVYHLPANAAVVWVETYPRHYTGSPCGMTCAGEGDTSKYGRTNRREVPVTQSINLWAPTVPIYGGTTGAIQVKILNSAGNGVNIAACNNTVTRNCISAHAWSVATPEGRITQGWATGTRNSTTTYKFAALAAPQKYVVWVDYANAAGAHKVVRTYIQVNQKATTYYSVNI